MQADFHARQKKSPQEWLLFTPRHSQNRAFSALRCFKCVCKTQCSFLLMKWRSLRTFMQADFHASMKSAHKNVRVNSNLSTACALASYFAKLYNTFWSTSSGRSAVTAVSPVSRFTHRLSRRTLGGWYSFFIA